jgi:ubiquinone/menaquinone biosynthesis C-methylase UbiE
MARIAPFEAHTERYERWFSRHEAAYRSELRALAPLVGRPRRALEVGVGTGRFAQPLGIAVGLDPSPQMLDPARRRGIAVVRGVAEALPFGEAVFDRVLVVTTLCFVDDPRAVLREARRVLVPGGAVVVGFIDRTSRLGRHYETHRGESVFYRDATFYSAAEVARLLAETGFGTLLWVQTLRKPLAETIDVEYPRPGVGEGAFVAVRATKEDSTSPSRGMHEANVPL